MDQYMAEDFVEHEAIPGMGNTRDTPRQIFKMMFVAFPDFHIIVHDMLQGQSAFDPVFPKGVRAYWRNVSLERLDDDVIDVLVRRGTEQTWTGTAFDVHHMGGAFSRVGMQDSPFPSRSAQYWINVYGFWTDADDDAARVAFVRGMADDLEPFSTGGRYVNFQGVEDDGHRLLDPAATFGPEAYARLVAVKRPLDPENIFHINQNIPPG